MDQSKFIKLRSHLDVVLNLGDTDAQLTKVTKGLPGLYQLVLNEFTQQLNEVKNLNVLKDEVYGKLFKKL